MNRYRVYPTRNYSASQSPMRPKGFCLHTTEGHGMAYLLTLLSGEVARDDGVRPSVHFLVSLKGEIWELAPWKPGEALVCWHAGRSEWGGISGLNRYLLGVEIEHVSGEQYPESQIRAVEILLRIVRAAYEGYIWEWGLLTHAQVAYPRGRKSDPTRPFDAIKGRWYAAWNQTEEEEDMTDEQWRILREVKLSTVAQSYELKWLRGKANRWTLDELSQVDADKAEAVAAKRKELGL